MPIDGMEDTPLGQKIACYLRSIIANLVHYIFVWYYANKGKKIPPISDDILKEPAIVVAKKIRNKEITSVEVLEACIKRINETKDALNCVVANRFDEAYKEARAADQLIRSGTMTPQQLEEEKPFLGVPFSTKDSIAVKGLPQTGGVFDRKGFIAPKDSEAIRRVREKGAIIIALTNVPEQCLWWETHNQVYGRTNNPYDTTKHVGGSSGGEGCIQAAGGSLFGIGSDIGGSIRMPAYFNGVFGHKTSMKIVDNDGQYPPAPTDIQQSMLVIGPLSKRAIDLKPILKILSGNNADKLDLDKPVDLSKLKIFYQFDCHDPILDCIDSEIVEGMMKIVNYFNFKYGVVGEKKHIPELKKSIDLWSACMRAPKCFANDSVGTNCIILLLWEMIKNFFGRSKHTFCNLMFAMLDRKDIALNDEHFANTIKDRDQFVAVFQEMLGENGVFLYPAHPTGAIYHNESIFKLYNCVYTCIINVLGMPCTSIPLGLNKEGVPIGFQVVANYNNDRLCLAVAEEVEKVFGGWVEPQNNVTTR